MIIYTIFLDCMLEVHKNNQDDLLYRGHSTSNIIDILAYLKNEIASIKYNIFKYYVYCIKKKKSHLY